MSAVIALVLGIILSIAMWIIGTALDVSNYEAT